MSDHPVWTEFTQEHPEFVKVYGDLFQTIPQLLLDPDSQGAGIVNKVVFELVLAVLQDADDILLLCSMDRPWGALKLLRGLFERTVTLKYLVQNPGEIETFAAYDVVDRGAILAGIERMSGLRPKKEATEWIDQAASALRKRLKQEKCACCKRTPPTNWTQKNTEELAKITGLEHLRLDAFVLPSKYIHPTSYGIGDLGKVEAAPLYGMLKATHILTLETALAHQRHFKHDPLAAQSVIDAVKAFFRVWVFAPNDFGLGKDFERIGGKFQPTVAKLDGAPIDIGGMID